MKKIFVSMFIIGLCLFPLMTSASPASKTFTLSIGESIVDQKVSAYGYHLIFSGFYDNSIAFEWRDSFCEDGKGCKFRSINDIYYYPVRIGFTFSLPEHPHLKATITSLDQTNGKVTLKIMDKRTREIKQ